MGKLASGPERLIDVFSTAAGILIVRSDALVLMGRDRTVQKMLMAPRPITTVAFDGTSLIVGDAAMITFYSLSLEAQGTVLLTEACASSVITKDGIFVCGPANDWDRIFYTYSVAEKKKIGQSARKFTYNGIPMRLVPGTNDFVTVTTNLSPSDFHLYSVDPAGADVKFLGESPYHGDFAATSTYGFAGTPPTHLVNVDGLLLRLLGPQCDGTQTSFGSGCFVKDGNLGTLMSGERFVAMANDPMGKLFAIMRGQATGSFYDPLCPGGCSVQQIDVEARTVMAQRKHQMAAKRFLALAPDPTCKMVAVGYEVATGSSSSSLDYSGYQIDLVDY